MPYRDKVPIFFSEGTQIRNVEKKNIGFLVLNLEVDTQNEFLKIR